jgi:hypothetical protein
LDEDEADDIENTIPEPESKKCYTNPRNSKPPSNTIARESPNIEMVYERPDL